MVVDNAGRWQRWSGKIRIMTFDGRPLKKQIISLTLFAGLAACSGGNPFDEPVVVDPTVPVTGETDGNGITVDGIPPAQCRPRRGRQFSVPKSGQMLATALQIV